MMNNTNLCTNMVGQQMTHQQMMQQQIMQMTIHQMMQKQIMQMMQQQAMQMTQQQMMQMNPQQFGMNNCQIQNHIIDNKCFNSEKKIDKGYITVSFIIKELNSNDHPGYFLQVRLDEKVRDIIERYRNMSGDRDLSKKFIFDSLDLDPD